MTPEQFQGWLQTARSGDRVVYATRYGIGGGMPVLSTAMTAYEGKLCVLFQSRIDDHHYEYVAVRTTVDLWDRLAKISDRQQPFMRQFA